VLLSYLPKNQPADLLSGLGDDAAAFRVGEDLAIVQTVDFITPVVNDPYLFGAIAAANALSDIYAMGASPIFALNIVSFPVKSMPMDTLGAIMAGGAQKAEEAGIAIVGGHSVDDNIPKYGLSVTGLVHPQKLVRKTGAQVGDVLVLTKPLGTGILATGVDNGIVSAEIESVMTKVMLELNRSAAEVMTSFPVHACTDISGYGLLGHLYEMLSPDLTDLTAVLSYKEIPILPQVWDVLKFGAVSSGTHANARYLQERVTWDDSVSPQEQLVLYDALTSGGLLIAVPEAVASALIFGLQQAGTLAAAPIGRVVKRHGLPLIIQP